ncbi:MAG: DUF2062 domain-containing protein [Ignavibacteriales bacterium]|nr:DUF2062 domain-containing protein [Ignavibacteriales bacterium]
MEACILAVKQFLNRALVVPLVGFLKQGLSPEKLALSVALGVTLGIFPLLGSTTILCGAIALLFGLNLPAIQLINYFASPLQLLFLIPFIRLGELLFNEAPLPLDVLQIITLLQSDTLGAIDILWWTTIHAIVAWLMIGPLLAAALYYILVRVFARLTLQNAE